jgi:hypothetical protein
LGILPLPFQLLLLGKEPHLGWLSLDPPTFLDGLEVAIDLDVIQGFLLVFAVLLLESSNIAVLAPPEVVAEIRIDRRAMKLKQSPFRRSKRGPELNPWLA